MRVGLIRHVIDQAVYAPWIEFASHIPGRPFYAFPTIGEEMAMNPQISSRNS